VLYPPRKFAPMGVSSLMDPAAPRRKYTVSDKGRAALRANLAKANAVPREVRFRSTPRRLEACRRNLEKAHAARRQKGGGNLRRGLYCASIERSLRQAGELLEDFQAHCERFLRVFPLLEGSAKCAVKGWAQAVWRRMRALRGEGRWESRLFGQWLARMESAAALHWLPSASSAFTQLFEVFFSRQTLERNLVKLGWRLQRLANLALWLGWRIDSSRMPKLDWIMRDPDALGNPFCSPRRVKEILKTKPICVSPVEQWQEWTVQAGLPDVDPASSAAANSTPGAAPASCPATPDGNPGACHPERSEHSEDGMPDSFASFAPRFEALLLQLTARSNPDPESRRELANAVWQRLKLFDEFAAAESKRLEDLIATAERPDLSRREVRDQARKLLEMMGTEQSVLDSAVAAEQCLLDAMRRCLTADEPLEIEIPEPGEIGVELFRTADDGIEFDDEDWDLDGEEDEDEDEDDEDVEEDDDGDDEEDDLDSSSRPG